MFESRRVQSEVCFGKENQPKNSRHGNQCNPVRMPAADLSGYGCEMTGKANSTKRTIRERKQDFGRLPWPAIKQLQS